MITVISIIAVLLKCAKNLPKSTDTQAEVISPSFILRPQMKLAALYTIYLYEH